MEKMKGKPIDAVLHEIIRCCIVRWIDIFNYVNNNMDCKLMYCYDLGCKDKRSYSALIDYFKNNTFFKGIYFTIDIDDNFEICINLDNKEPDGIELYLRKTIPSDIEAALREHGLIKEKKNDWDILLKKYLEDFILNDPRYTNYCEKAGDSLKEITVNGYDYTVSFNSGIACAYTHEKLPEYDMTASEYFKQHGRLEWTDYVLIRDMIKDYGLRLRSLVNSRYENGTDKYFLCAIIEDFIRDASIEYDKLFDQSIELTDVHILGNKLCIELYHSYESTEPFEDYSCSIVININELDDISKNIYTRGVEMVFSSKNDMHITRCEYELLDDFLDELIQFVCKYLSYIPEEDRERLG